jgi:serine/threonine protein kinase
MPISPNLSRFDILHLLGKGGSGSVYLAQDRSLSKKVALKLVSLRDIDSMLDAERKGALLQQNLARRSPQVPQVFDFGEEGDYFWIAMEYIEGTDLSDALRAAPFPEDRAAQIAIQLCGFLVKLHDFTGKIGDQRILGMIHGDLKPHNIRLQNEDVVRVIDFGIAKQLSLSRKFTQSFYGTLPYTPPEQIKTGIATPRSDLWAVGVILYQMVSGHLPIREGSVHEAKWQLLEGDLIPLPDHCSRGLRWIINTSLHKSPDDRYSSATEIREDLSKFLNGTFSGYEKKQRLSHETTAERSRPEGTPTLTLPKDRNLSEPPPAVPQVPNSRKETPSPSALSSAANQKTSKPKWAKISLLLAFLAVIIALACQAYAWREAEAIRKDLIANPSINIENNWHRYQNLRKFDLLGIGQRDAQNEVKLSLTNAGNAILTRYAESDPLVDKETWKKALDHFTRALELNERDHSIRARASFCRGHLALLESRLFKRQRNLRSSRDKQEEAVNYFGSSGSSVGGFRASKPLEAAPPLASWGLTGGVK